MKKTLNWLITHTRVGTRSTRGHPSAGHPRDDDVIWLIGYQWPTSNGQATYFCLKLHISAKKKMDTPYNCNNIRVAFLNSRQLSQPSWFMTVVRYKYINGQSFVVGKISIETISKAVYEFPKFIAELLPVRHQLIKALRTFCLFLFCWNFKFWSNDDKKYQFYYGGHIYSSCHKPINP